MSDKKPGFFKRLLSTLTGGKDEAAPEDTPKAEPKAKAPARKPAKKAEPKAKAKAKAKKAEPAKAEPDKKPAGGKAAATKKPAAETPPAGKADTGRKTSGKTAAKSETSAAKPAAKTGKKPATRKSAKAGPAPAGEPEPAEPLPAPEAGPEPDEPVAAQPEPEEPVAPEPAAAAEPEPGEEPAKKGWFSRLRDGLSKTSSTLTDNITSIFTKRKLDDQTLQELEDVLIQADLGVDTAIRITEAVAKGRYNKEIAPEEVRAVLGAEVARVLEPMARPLELDETRKPNVILVVGVNGTGKTTTIGKLAHRFASEGKKVVMAAGDTFRAAAIDQLKIWGERTGAPVIARDVGADAAGLAYDALVEARAQDADALLIDTAGRLQNKADLMGELSKIVRVLKKLDETAPHSVLLVLDATTGQNAVNQAQVFREIAGVTGIVMTKLDGTARGGILVAIAEQFALPIHAIGVGETVEDLQPFDAYDFAAAIAGAHEQVEA